MNDVISGVYTQPTALGPNALSKSSIKARSITGSMIDVADLSAASTKTGSLDVNGTLTIDVGGSLQSGKTSYSDVAHAGYWIGIDSGVAKIRVGNIGNSNGWYWDGAALTIAGTVTATTGTIGGWTIGTTDLTADSGATGLSSAGSYRLWTGNSTPSLAPFSVNSAGAIKSTSGSIGGWDIDQFGIRLSTGSGRGIDTGSTTFYAGSTTPSSAPFRVTSGGALFSASANITGAISASSLSITGTASFSGGSMILPNGGSITSTNVDLNQGTLAGLTVDGTITIGATGRIQWNSTGSFIDSDDLVLTSNGVFGSGITLRNAGDRGYIYTDTSNFIISTPNGTGLYIASGRDMAIETISGDLSLITQSDVITTLGDSSGATSFKILSHAGTWIFGVGSSGELVRQITNDATSLGAYYGRIPIYINGSLKYIPVYS